MSDSIDRIASVLHSDVMQMQDEILDNAKQVVTQWLQTADAEGRFEDAVDWLFYGEGSDLLEQRSGTLAFDAIRYVIDQFIFSDNDDGAEDDFVTELGKRSISSALDYEPDKYDEVREWFSI